MAPADRDQTWVRALAARRGFAFTDLSAADHQQLRVDGDLGTAGGHRPWSCVAHREYPADGGAEDRVEWTCLSLLAAGPDRELSVGFGDGGASLGSTGHAGADLAVLGAGIVGSLLRGRGGGRGSRPPRVVDDVVAASDVHDPVGLLAGPVRALYAHWPVPPDPPPGWTRTARRLLGTPEYPPDAPPRPFWLGMSVHGPLSLTSRDWWQRPAWLEHQIDLGIALGVAVVAARAHA